MAGVTPVYRTFDGTEHEALRMVISLNVHRRHLNESQRAMVAGRLAVLKLGSNQHEGAPIGAPSLTQAEAAAMMHVGRASVQRARVVLEEGTPELIAAVDSGKTKVSAAAVT